MGVSNGRTNGTTIRFGNQLPLSVLALAERGVGEGGGGRLSG